jgi:pimeloyl-ACP methyl ester carboxylesterase
MCDVRSEEALQTYAHYLSEVDALVLDPIIAAQWLDGYDFEAIAAKIAAPVLLLQADMKAGGMLTDDEANRFSQCASNCRLKKFEGASHLIHATHADALAHEMNAFLQSILPTLA